jgi:hypothetical protein
MPRGINIYDEAQIQRRLWTPQILAPALWLDASDISTISVATGVSEWRDKSGKARHFSMATAGNQPLYVTNALNGRSVINFVSTDSLQTSTAIPFNDLGNNTLYLVANRTGRTGIFNVAVILSRAAARTRSILPELTGTPSKWGTYTSVPTPSPAGSVGTTYQICELIADQATNSYLFYQNGTSQGSAGTVNVNTVFNNGVSYLGNDQYNSWFQGNIAEVIFSDEKHSDATREIVEGYLAHKWGLLSSLPVSHPFRNRPPLIGD